MEDEVDVESVASGSSSATESLQNQQDSPNGIQQAQHHRPSYSSTDSAVQTSIDRYDNNNVNNEVKQLKQWFKVFAQLQTRDRLYKAIVIFCINNGYSHFRIYPHHFWLQQTRVLLTAEI